MKTPDKKEQIQISLCRSTRGISMTAMIIVAVLELIMLGYTAANSQLFGSLIWRYRSFYIFLLTVAVTYMIVSLYVKKDIEHRYVLMNIANPLCAVLFYAWSLGITWSDFIAVGTVDPTVFMTFSMVVPLGFYMSPWIYGIIVVAADALMIWVILNAAGHVGLIINSGIFFIFQIVLGTNYLRMKLNVARHIVEEKENALVDVLTGCPNRRAYEEEIRSYVEGSIPGDLIYVAIDINGLKEVNDIHGHESGDHLIIGAARCIESNIGKKGQTFRIGGDEFAVLVRMNQQELENILPTFKTSMESWSEENGLLLTTSYGYACAFELSDHQTIIDLARMADARMYQAKARYYQMNGNDRRKKYLLKEQEAE